MQGPTLSGLLLAFVILFVVFRAIEFFRPRARRLPILRRGLLTDGAYWLFTPFVTKAITRICVAGVAIPFALLVYGKIDRELILQGFGPAAQLPFWVQAIGILVIGDFVGYWMHRAFHGRRLWRFHAIHHSSVDLDWLSAVRLHPVNDALMRVAGTLPVLALGFAPVAVAGIVPVLTLMAILVHANVDWDWGPLRSVIASPRFHRWHHTDEKEARDTNFAGLLPVWDILFGTYHMPKHVRPTSFGTATPVPNGLIGQIMFPFRRTAMDAAPAPPRPAKAAERLAEQSVSAT
jgi:sterol desaturase/sphingolipid hydroxylase (fatty acid hydroxylase superfamily)